MTIKFVSLLLFCALSAQLFGQKSYKKEYSLTLKGLLTDHNDQPIDNAVIKIKYNPEPVKISSSVITESIVDKSGKYTISLKKFGQYKIEVIADNKISYHLHCYYSEKMALNLHKRKYEIPFNMQLFPQTKNISVDIYNGGEFKAKSAEIEFIPFKRYMQTHDYELRDGFKSQKKITKYIAKKLKKLKLEEILAITATRPEIDSVITNEKFYPEVRKKWHQFFGLTRSNLDKERVELIQDFFNKISEKDDEGEPLYKYKNHILDLTKTVVADDTKEVFNLYRYNFTSANGKIIAYDVMLFKSPSGWKINYIAENYL